MAQHALKSHFLNGCLSPYVRLIEIFPGLCRLVTRLPPRAPTFPACAVYSRRENRNVKCVQIVFKFGCTWGGTREWAEYNFLPCTAESSRRWSKKKKKFVGQERTDQKGTWSSFPRWWRCTWSFCIKSWNKSWCKLFSSIDALALSVLKQIARSLIFLLTAQREQQWGWRRVFGQEMCA